MEEIAITLLIFGYIYEGVNTPNFFKTKEAEIAGNVFFTVMLVLFFYFLFTK